MDRGPDRRLGACAFERDVWFRATHRLHDTPCNLFGCLVRCHAEGAHAFGGERFGKCKPPRVEVGDNERVRTCRARAEQRREADRPRTAYQRRVAEPQVCAVYSCEGDGERLQQRAVLEGERWRELVAPHRRVCDVAPQQSRNGGRRTEEDALAAVVATSETRRAGVAWDARFDRYSVAGFKIRHGWVDGDDLAQMGAVDIGVYK